MLDSQRDAHENLHTAIEVWPKKKICVFPVTSKTKLG